MYHCYDGVGVREGTGQLCDVLLNHNLCFTTRCQQVIDYVITLFSIKLLFFASDSAEKLIMTVVSRGLAVTPLEKLEINLSLQVPLQ